MKKALFIIILSLITTLIYAQNDSLKQSDNGAIQYVRNGSLRTGHYSINGKQYVVIACGGGKIGSKSGDQYVAFSLP